MQDPQQATSPPLHRHLEGQVKAADRRRQKHNAGETRRRKRLNEQFGDLKQLVDSMHDTKPAILKDTLDFIVKAQSQLEAYRNIIGNNTSKPETPSSSSSSSSSSQPSSPNCTVCPSKGEDESGKQLKQQKQMQEVSKSLVQRQQHCVQQNYKLSFSSVFSSAKAPRLVTDIAGMIVACNSLFADLIRYPLSEILVGSCTHGSILDFSCRPYLVTVLKQLLVGKLTTGHVHLSYVTSTKVLQGAQATVWLSPFEGKTYFDHVLQLDDSKNRDNEQVNSISLGVGSLRMKSQTPPIQENI